MLKFIYFVCSNAIYKLLSTPIQFICCLQLRFSHLVQLKSHLSTCPNEPLNSHQVTAERIPCKARPQQFCFIIFCSTLSGRVRYFLYYVIYDTLHDFSASPYLLRSFSRQPSHSTSLLWFDFSIVENLHLHKSEIKSSAHDE